MKKDKNSAKKVRIKEIVRSNLERMGTADINEIIEILRPHYDFNVSRLIERELRTRARRVMGSFRDECGVRIYFSDNEGRYINIDNADNIEDLNKVRLQLHKKYSGLSAALKKVRKLAEAIQQKFGKQQKYY